MKKSVDPVFDRELVARRGIEFTTVEGVSKAFDKPVEFTTAALKQHGVDLPLPMMRSPNDGLDGFYSDMTSVLCIDPSLTQQHLAAECDINNIVALALRTGQLPSVGEPLFSDVSDIPSDYHLALNTVLAGDEAFMTLEAKVRSRFNNDVGQFLDFVANPANRDEAIALGLIPAPKEPELPPAPSQGRGGKKGSGKAPVEPEQGDEGE